MKKREGVNGYLREVVDAAFDLREMQWVLHQCMVAMLAADELKEWCATMPNKGTECFSKAVFDACDDANVRLLAGLYGQVEKTHDGICKINEIEECSDCEICNEYEEDYDDVAAIEEEGYDENDEGNAELTYKDTLWWSGCELLTIYEELQVLCSKIMLAAGKVADERNYNVLSKAFTIYHIERCGDPSVVLLSHLVERTIACYCVLGYRNGLEFGDDLEAGDEDWD